MSNQSSKEAALDWAKNQGFHLEMKVNRIFRNAGFETSLLEHYSDPDTNKIREIDVVAWTSTKVHSITVQIQFFIECKHIPQPWVVFTTERKPKPYEGFSYLLNGDYNFHNWRHQRTFHGRLLARILSKHNPNTKTFGISEPYGFTLLESHTKNISNKDSAISALYQVTKSTYFSIKRGQSDLEKMVAESEEERSPKQLNLLIQIPFPLIIIRGKGQLFKAHLDSNDDLDLTEIDQCTIYSAKKPGDLAAGKPIVVPVRVLRDNTPSYEKISKFASQAKKDIASLLSEKSAIEAVWKYENDKVFARTDELSF